MTYLKLPFQIPGYRILRRIGIGGMATVYLAIQESLSRPVAVKVLASERAPSDELVRRFEHEARTIALLDHPNIVGIFDVGRTSSGDIYYTMPYLPNGDLSARNLRDRPDRVLEVMRALAEALGCAHDQGIVHRDVKPENVLFDKLDRPLLTDFGIALSGSHQPRVTREGATIGSSGYMSPEQARGQPLDGRSDFYSLGVVCYELLTGEMPFQGADALSVALAHIEKPVPRLPVTRRIWQPLIDKALAKHPDARFQSAEELLAAIDIVDRRMHAPGRAGFAHGWLPVLNRLYAVPRRIRALALGALILIALAGLIALLPRTPDSAVAPASLAVATPVAAPAAAADPATGTAPATIGSPPPAGDGLFADVTSGTGANPGLTQASREQHLRQAADLIAGGRLAAPAGNNAAEHYLAILKDTPGQRDATRGIARILGLLGARAARAIAAGEAKDAVASMMQGAELATRARVSSSRGLADFVAPIHGAIEARRARPHDPFDTTDLAMLAPLLPALARIDPAQARALEADLRRPAELLRDGGAFRDAGGPGMIVVPGARAFAIAVDDVDRGAYARFAAATGRPPARCRASQRLFARSSGLDWRHPGFDQTDAHPVVCVSWNDADAYARWLGRRTGARYRLPGAQEWLRVAQAAGSGLGCNAANIGARSGTASGCDDGYAQTSPVGSFPATPPGLHDIAGNVSEWIDGCAKSGGAACDQRRFRGLSWRDDDGESNLARSDTADTDIGYANVGFRVVRELPSTDPPR